MNYFQAQELLNKVKEGQPTPQHLINLALELTGDLNEPVLSDERPFDIRRPATGRATPFFGPRSDQDAS